MINGHGHKNHYIVSSLEWLILLAPFLWGGFFPWCAAVLSLVLCVLLLLLVRKHIRIHSKSPVLLLSLAIVVFHLGGVIWGVDRGMALVGTVQFLPLPLFVLLLEQLVPEQRIPLLRRIPYAACLMVILSLFLSRIYSLEGWFTVAGRQAGFFQYPNTYAVYLLFAVVLVLFGTPLRFGPIPWLSVLIPGILLSGSRIVFVLLLGVLLSYFFWEKRASRRKAILFLLCLFLASGVPYLLLTQGKGVIGRYLTISGSSSEFLGRLLYARDALPVILKHPLGLGYTGYRWLQGSFQTGVYSVQHVHNELLQLLLDVGWIPTGLFLWVLWKSLRSPVGGFCRKMLLAVLLLHCLLDFDTQFVSIALLLFLILDVSPQASQPLRFKSLGVVSLICAASLSFWIGLASFFAYLQDSAVAVKIDPGYTEALVSLLSEATPEDADQIADRVLKLNSSTSAAHDAKTRFASQSGDLDAMLFHKREAIRLSRYQLWEYLDYFEILRFAYERCLGVGDTQGAVRYLQSLFEIPRMLEDVKAQTSSLGWRIRDLPSLDLPPEYTAWLDAHRMAS